MNKFLGLLAIFALTGFVFAQQGSPAGATQAATSLKTVLQTICNLSAGLLGPIAFVLIVLAGVVYAGSQFFGAEARANGTKWAMTMITGAIVAFLLWIIAPMIITAFSGGSYSIGSGACTFT